MSSFAVSYLPCLLFLRKFFFDLFRHHMSNWNSTSKTRSISYALKRVKLKKRWTLGSNLRTKHWIKKVTRVLSGNLPSRNYTIREKKTCKKPCERIKAWTLRGTVFVIFLISDLRRRVLQMKLQEPMKMIMMNVLGIRFATSFISSG